ncbi:putative membrane protein [Thioploca ingrica]|uniref:Putative membrane protein n=1 Tax=Thioploca ingrica TaxID=40754 RepID=A0A090AIE1_9GAMM|nr:putative membrane protein [Thioploca ingrica]
MWWLVPTIFKLVHWLWRLWLWIWLLLCLFILLAAFLFAKLPEYRAEVEQLLNAIWKQPITIGQLDTYWVDGMPAIAVQQVHLVDTQIEIAYAEVVIDVLASLRQARWVTQSITAKSSQLALTRTTEGRITVVGLPASASQSPGHLEWLVWLWQQPTVSIQVATLQWLEPKQIPLTFSAVELSLSWQDHVPWLRGQVNFPQETFSVTKPTRLDMQAQRLTFATGLLEPQVALPLRIEGQFTLEQLQLLAPVNLPPQTLQGRFFADQSTAGTWQIQSQQQLVSSKQTLELPELKIHISPTEQPFLGQPIESLLLPGFINRLSQNLLQQPKPNSGSTATVNWFSSLPLILRPTVAQEIEAPILVTHTNQSQPVEISAQLSRLSLNEWLSQLLDYLEPNWQKTLLALQPQGQLADIQWQYTPNQMGRIRGRLVNFASQPDEQWPGIQGLSGDFELTARQSTLTLKPATLVVNWPRYYKQPLLLKIIAGQFQWQLSPQGKHLVIPDLQVQLDQQLTMQLTGQIDMPLNSKRPVIQLQVRCYQGNLAQLWRYVPIQLQPQLASLVQLNGELTQAQVILTGDNQATEFEVKGQIKQVNFNWISPQTQVMVKDLSAHFNIAPHQIALKVNNATATVDLPNLYSHSLSVTQIKGDLNWQGVPGQWQLSTHKLQAVDHKTKIQITGHLKQPLAAAVESHLQINLHQGQLSQVYYYLPDKKLTKPVNWLKQSLLNGEIHTAQASLEGPLQTLFHNPKGFNFKSQVNNAQIQYASSWPALSRVNAQVFIQGRTLTVQAQSGHLLNSQLNATTVTIADLSNPKQTLVQVTGHLHGAASDGLKFIEQSPLRTQLNLSRLDLDGLMDLQLNLAIPLTKGRTQVAGQIRFTDTTLQDKSLNITLTEVNGQLNFNDDQVHAPQLQGKLLGNPITFSLLTLRNERPKRTTVQVSGWANPLLLAQQINHFVPSLAPIPITTYLSGESQWIVTVNFPNETVKENNDTDIQIETDLLGMAVNLPAPLDKIAQEQRFLSIKVRLPNKISHFNHSPAIEVQGYYGQILNSVLQINQQRLERGSIVFGTTPAQLPPTAMLNIQGKLNTLSTTAWQKRFAAPASDFSLASSHPDNQTALNRWLKPIPLFSLPISLEVYFDQLELLGQNFNQVALQAKYAELLGQLAITSKEVEGQIKFNQLGSPSLDLVFQKLRLTHLSSSQTKPTQPMVQVTNQSQPPDPHDLPPISFHCNELQIGDTHLGTVTFQGQAHPEGLAMTLSAQTLGLDLNMKGLWRYVVQQHQTSVEVQLNSDNTRLMLQQLGYQQPPLTGKQTQITLNAYWQSAPYPFNLSTLVGTLSLVIAEGNIVNVEPGPIGRIFGLFDVYTLPRRLALDFSDVFKKGFGFNTLAGVFFLQAGQAYTDQLILQSPAAHIKIQGQTNLIDKTYEQVVTVFPQLANPLPVASALAGGVGVGAAAWVVQQLLQSELQKVIYSQYRITGPWQKPAIIPLPHHRLPPTPPEFAEK